MAIQVRVVSAVVAVVVLCLAAPATASSGSAQAATAQVDHPVTAVLGGAPRLVDDLGRQVLLRGVNVVQLGDYYQDDPASPPTFPLTEDDVARIAELGFDVVRLIVHWSALEPTPGTIDETYLDRIDQALTWAADHDLYVVLDLHQDAWSKYVATPPDATCPPPTSPSVGWDGAPEWATITDGQSTCQLQAREFSPAVLQAFTNFWADRPAPDGTGIQSHVVAVWRALAERFGADPVVAGYDLFNEPHPGYTAGASETAALAVFYRRATDAIRAGEQAAGAPIAHPVFFEPTVLWSGFGADAVPPPGFTDDDAIVFAPHLYAGSISFTPGVGVDEGFQAAQAVADAYGSTFWSGEWGWFGDDPDAQAADVARYAQLEDEHVVGGAWWDWRQACGDPHNHRTPNSEPRPISPSLVRYACPGNVELGIPEAFRTILSRPYPRAAPGVIDVLTSDPATTSLHLEASGSGASVGNQADLWVPDTGVGAPVVEGTGLGPVTVRRVAGGWRILVTVVEDAYVIDVALREPAVAPPDPAAGERTTSLPSLPTTGGGAVLLAGVAFGLAWAVKRGQLANDAGPSSSSTVTETTR